jgi:hypothetical protein
VSEEQGVPDINACPRWRQAVLPYGNPLLYGCYHVQKLIKKNSHDTGWVSNKYHRKK